MRKLLTLLLTKLFKTLYPTSMIPHHTFLLQKSSLFQSSNTDPAHSPHSPKLNLMTILSHASLDASHHLLTTEIHDAVPSQTIAISISLRTLMSPSTYNGNRPHIPPAFPTTSLANNCGYGSHISPQRSLLVTTMNF